MYSNLWLAGPMGDLGPFGDAGGGGGGVSYAPTLSSEFVG